MSDIPPRNWNIASIEFSNAFPVLGLSFRTLAATYSASVFSAEAAHLVEEPPRASRCHRT